MNEDNLNDLFKALGHPIRRTILDLLKNGPKTTNDISDQFDEVSRFAIMKHLNQLVDANLVLIRREGRNRLNYINIVPLEYLSDRWVTKYQSIMAQSLFTLKSNIEGENNTMSKNNWKQSFEIEQEIAIKGKINLVFGALTENINDWWAYRLLGDRSKLSLEPKVGGKFVEIVDHEHGALWGTITFINAPYEIRLNGLLGMKGAVNSAFSFKLEERGEDTILKLSHHAVGLIDPNWEEAHRNGWEELLGKFLKTYVENGKGYKENQ
ncbi:helix-turn-helix domain-containing protein [Bacillus salitolerans]|uniref:Helix-turn-helix domain-containing protein n=1 Tax=Bacillus salitolerans TaxID=1437434 RepID=A0ABW4LP72_9BACI